jgi:hypothetical protein
MTAYMTLPTPEGPGLARQKDAEVYGSGPLESSA